MKPGRTAQGLWIYLDHPERQTLDFRDFTRHLGNYRRFRGAGLTVLQHSCLAARLSPHRELRGFLAVHDLHETYIGDLDPVMKQRVGFHDLEARWEDMVAQRILGRVPTGAEQSLMASVDLWAAAVEARAYDLGAFLGFPLPAQTVADTLLERPSIRCYIHYLQTLTPSEQYEELTRWEPRLHNLSLLGKQEDA